MTLGGWIAIFSIVIVVLIVALGVVITLAVWDWRAWLYRKYGNDYKKGLARIRVNGMLLYRDSALFFEDDAAMTYIRKSEPGYPTPSGFAFDTVPTARCGFIFEEGTGRRSYRVRPGGGIAWSDDPDAPAGDFPGELLSPHLLGRTAVNVATSVNAEGGMPWKTIIIIAAIIAVLGVAAFFMFKPGAAPAKSPAQSSNVTQTAPSGGGTVIINQGGQ
jgi:hypothetical protein